MTGAECQALHAIRQRLDRYELLPAEAEMKVRELGYSQQASYYYVELWMELAATGHGTNTPKRST